MFAAFSQAGRAVQRAALQRAVLLCNHVLAAEPAATQRLQAHAGRRFDVLLHGWPALLPDLPSMQFDITPAGLLEWRDAAAGLNSAAAAELTVSITLPPKAGLLTPGWQGLQPTVALAGDAALAADLNWVVDNVRWDVQDDLTRWLGAGPAHQLVRQARAVAGGLRAAVQALRQRVNAMRPPPR